MNNNNFLYQKLFDHPVLHLIVTTELKFFFNNFREYKEALRQQRAHDVPSIYRTKDTDDQTYKTEPNTPTHQLHSSLATSKSDPTPLNSVLNAKYIFDDDTKKSTEKLTSPYKSPYATPKHLLNGNHTTENTKNISNPNYVQDYVKPKSPVRVRTGILTQHENGVHNGCNNGNGLGTLSPRGHSPGGYFNGSGSEVKVNGVKNNRSISWNKEVTSEKMTFTMRREIDKAREETDLINQLRNVSFFICH